MMVFSCRFSTVHQFIKPNDVRALGLMNKCAECCMNEFNDIILAFGESDEYGIKVAKDEVHVHDFHATILHLLGLDHEKLTFRHAGRDFRLTDVAGKVVKGILS